jgi:hypothetical protein
MAAVAAIVLLWVRHIERRSSKAQMAERRTEHLDHTKQDFVAGFCFWGKFVLNHAQVLVPGTASRHNRYACAPTRLAAFGAGRSR